MRANELAIYDVVQRNFGGIEFKSESKDENLNVNLPPKEQGARIGKTIWRPKFSAYLYMPVCLC